MKHTTSSMLNNDKTDKIHEEMNNWNKKSQKNGKSENKYDV